MSQLKIFDEHRPDHCLLVTENVEVITQELAELGIQFERWNATVSIEDQASSEEIIESYKPEIEKLIKENGYQSYDVVNMYPEHPLKEELRTKFLAEHTHEDDEVRFFVKGGGLFTLHINQKVYEVICEKDDLIRVPANTPHWFDMSDHPSFTCIRFFNSSEGWLANYTGSNIADNFSRLERMSENVPSVK